MMQHTISSRFALPLLLVLICVVYLFRGVLVEPPKVDPDHIFNTERAFARLERILGDEAPHPVDTAANDLVRDRLVSEIEALGFAPIIGDEFHCVERRARAVCARLRNIAFWVTEPGPNAVLIGSHYDSVPAGPGASDDGAGFAASLEIAAILKTRETTRPVLVLITDGEEVGLMGADLFVRHDPLARMVGAVVNLEARGVTGLAALIQTSRPNGRDLAALDSTTRLPAASSLNADIYELLPNDTDMTEFLTLDIDAANFAFAGRPALYHTPGDNLENLDKRSLFNIGASALAATLAFIGQSGTEAETQWLYVDLLGQMLIKLPVWLGGALLVVCALLSLALLWRSLETRGGKVRVLAVPPVAIGAGLLLAICATMLIDAVRVERLFGAAYPIALRGTHVTAALAGALIPYTFMTRAGDARALMASAWLWVALFGLLAFVLVPGASIMFVPAAAVFALAALALHLGYERIGQGLAVFGIIVFLLVALPLSALGETGLFIEASAPFAAIAIFAFALTVPFIWPDEDNLLRWCWLCGLGTGAAAIAFMAASLIVPAYSPQAPRALPVIHIQGDDIDGAHYIVRSTDPVPDEMLEIAAFESGTLEPVYNRTVQRAPAPDFASAGIEINITSDQTEGDIRTLALDLYAPDSDRVLLVLRGETKLVTAELNGRGFAFEDEPFGRFTCIGRACRIVQFTMQFDAASRAPDLEIYTTRFGLDPQSAALLAARPANAITIQTGDHRLVYKTLAIDPEPEQAAP